MEIKFCKFCQIEHPLTDEWWFFCKDGRSACKIQKREYQRIHASAARERNKRYYEGHKEATADKHKAYYDANKEKVNQHNRDSYHKNPEKVKSVGALWRHANGDALRRKANDRRRADLNFKLKVSLRDRIRKALHSDAKTGSAVRDLGCSITELKRYLESKFQDGMTWDNWGLRGWHIDHIVPLSSFDLTDRAQFLKACHYTNLQPLWAEENWSKSDKQESNEKLGSSAQSDNVSSVPKPCTFC